MELQLQEMQNQAGTPKPDGRQVAHKAGVSKMHRTSTVKHEHKHTQAGEPSNSQELAAIISAISLRVLAKYFNFSFMINKGTNRPNSIGTDARA